MKVAPVKRIENGMERRFGMAFLGRYSSEGSLHRWTGRERERKEVEPTKDGRNKRANSRLRSNVILLGHLTILSGLFQDFDIICFVFVQQSMTERLDVIEWADLFHRFMSGQPFEIFVATYITYRTA